MSIYNKILQDLEKALPFLDVPMPKVGRKPKLGDVQTAALFIIKLFNAGSGYSFTGSLFDDA